MEVRTRVSLSGKRIYEVVAEVEHGGNLSKLLRTCLEEHPQVRALRMIGETDTATQMAREMLAEPVVLELNKLDCAILSYLKRGADSLERIFKNCNVDQRRDADALTVTPGMLSGFLVQMVKLVRIGAADCEGEALSGQWFLTDEGEILAQEVRL